MHAWLYKVEGIPISKSEIDIEIHTYVQMCSGRNKGQKLWSAVFLKIGHFVGYVQ